MNSEREIVKKLFESKNEELDEKTYTVGDTQYWKRGGKTYKWSASGGRSECSEDEYMKAISGGNGDTVKNTPPENDKARQQTSSSGKAKSSNHEVGFQLGLGDWSYTKVGDNTWETTYKGKKQDNRTDADIDRVFSGANEESRIQAIKDPEEKRVFIAVSDTMAEYGDNISGSKKTDADIRMNYYNYVRSGQTKYLKNLANIMYDLTGSPEYRFKTTPPSSPTKKSTPKNFTPPSSNGVPADVLADAPSKKSKSRTSAKKATNKSNSNLSDAEYDAMKMQHFADEAIDKLAQDEETVATTYGSTIELDLGDKDMHNEKLINRLKELGFKQTSPFRFTGYNHK